MNNKKFRKTEEAILRIFFEEDIDTSIDRIVKRIGVARSTFYNHHKAIRAIIPDYEKFLLLRFRRKIRHLSEKPDIKIHNLQFEVLIFILKHQDTFLALIKNEKTTVIHEMISELIPKIEQPMGLPKNSEKIIRVYVGEVVEVIKIWGENGFKDTEIKAVLSNIMYLTNTARIRLKPLLA